jgi:endonuclease/exonuclease/phosphatase family metal-dependent hydrolase
LILTVENNRTVGSSGPPFVVVMGDMNTLSPMDDTMLQQMTIENHTLLQALSSMPCYNSMKKKFLKYPWYNEFNYEPMHHLLQRANLIDTSILRRPTEPTNIPCDQAKHCTCPHLRLDYMLVSKQFIGQKPHVSVTRYTQRYIRNPSPFAS